VERSAIFKEIALMNPKGAESDAWHDSFVGNGERVEARQQRLFPSAIDRNRRSARADAKLRA
jgi:hypothetical protein